MNPSNYISANAQANSTFGWKWPNTMVVFSAFCSLYYIMTRERPLFILIVGAALLFVISLFVIGMLIWQKSNLNNLKNIELYSSIAKYFGLTGMIISLDFFMSTTIEQNLGVIILLLIHTIVVFRYWLHGDKFNGARYKINQLIMISTISMISLGINFYLSNTDASNHDSYGKEKEVLIYFYSGSIWIVSILNCSLEMIIKKPAVNNQLQLALEFSENFDADNEF